MTDNEPNGQHPKFEPHAFVWPPPEYAHAATMKVVRPMKTAPDDEDVEIVVPDFFKRTGNRTFTIESGLGKVYCIVARDDQKDRIEAQRDAYYKRTGKTPTEEDKRNDLAYMVCMASMRAIPETWHVEDDEVKINETVLKEGDPIPQPKSITCTTPETAMTYIGLLPPSFAGQLLFCLGLFNHAPIDVEVAQNPPSPAESMT